MTHTPLNISIILHNMRSLSVIVLMLYFRNPCSYEYEIICIIGRPLVVMLKSWNGLLMEFIFLLLNQ